MKRTFEAWSLEQFGRRPTTIDDYRLATQIREMKAELARLEDLRARAALWDESHRAARYAWNVWQQGEGK